MKNYLKKFSVMFVMLLAIAGVVVIQQGTVANAATTGQPLLQAEDGWQRFDDRNENIKYVGSWTQDSRSYGNDYKSTMSQTITQGDKMVIYFYGSNFRLITDVAPSAYRGSVNIKIDDLNTDLPVSLQGASTAYQILSYEKTNLPKTIHKVTMTSLENKWVVIDALDIDKDGYLLSPSISLDKSSVDLTVGDSKQLTSTTTPAALGVVWSSSDDSIATVDENGNVKGIKEGQVTITVTINDESNISATCTVNVIPKGSEPTDPEEPAGDGALFIELVDGNIKTYDVTSNEIDDFIDWYKDRDLDDSKSPVYKFNKGDYKDYVVHDKIDWFEVR